MNSASKPWLRAENPSSGRVMRWLPVIALVFLMPGLAACGNGTPGGDDPATPTVVDEPEAQPQRLPEDWPETFPDPPNARLATVTGDLEAGITVFWDSADAHDELLAFYEQALPDRGWTIDKKSVERSEAVEVTNFTISGHQLEGVVAITDLSDQQITTVAAILSRGAR